MCTQCQCTLEIRHLIKLNRHTELPTDSYNVTYDLTNATFHFWIHDDFERL